MLHFWPWDGGDDQTRLHVSASTFNRARKFPEFLPSSVVTPSFFPRSAIPCFDKNRIAHIICLRICLFSFILSCRELSVITLICDSGLSIGDFIISAFEGPHSGTGAENDC